MSPLAAVTKNRIPVGISDMKVSTDPDTVLKTYALGTCVGVAVYDVEKQVGGLLHFQLPRARGHEHTDNPFMFADTGLSTLLNTLFELGATRRNLRIMVAGGAQIGGENTGRSIARKNLLVLKKLLWKNGLMIHAEDTGGAIGRNMALHLDTGRVTISANNREYELKRGVA